MVKRPHRCRDVVLRLLHVHVHAPYRRGPPDDLLTRA
jgi:hypothetical protein